MTIVSAQDVGRNRAIPFKGMLCIPPPPSTSPTPTPTTSPTSTSPTSTPTTTPTSRARSSAGCVYFYYY